MVQKLAEAADVASPRTAWSTHNRKELSTWMTCHSSLVSAASNYRYDPRADRRTRSLVLFGDSITESWRGTSYGRAVPRTKGVPAALNKTLGRHWPSPIPLGIAADCTQHLLWRMSHGELTEAMAQDPSFTAVLLIGTNNLGRGYTTDQTVRGIAACANYLLNATRGRLLINAVLPRGDRRKRSRHKGHHFLHEVATVNAALDQRVFRNLWRAYPRRVSYTDCGRPFYTTDAIDMLSASASAPSPRSAAAAGLELLKHGAAAVRGSAAAGDRVEWVRRDLMPDRLHPNAAGQLLWGHCLVKALSDAEEHGWSLPVRGVARAP